MAIMKPITEEYLLKVEGDAKGYSPSVRDVVLRLSFEVKKLSRDRDSSGAAVAMLRNWIEKIINMDGTDILEAVREDLDELLSVTAGNECLNWFEDVQEQALKTEKKLGQYMQAHRETQARADRLERDCRSLLYVLRNVFKATVISEVLDNPPAPSNACKNHIARVRALLAGGTKEFRVEPGTDHLKVFTEAQVDRVCLEIETEPGSPAHQIGVEAGRLNKKES